MDRRAFLVMQAWLADQKVRFLLAGGSAALVNWLARFPLSLFLPYPVAVAAALAIGMVYGFVIYRQWAFGSTRKRSVLLEIRDFIAVNAAGGAVTVIVAIAANWVLGKLHLPPVAAEGAAHAMGIGLGAVVNYIGHKHITFRKD